MIYINYLIKKLFIVLLVTFFSCSRSIMRDSINMNWKVSDKNKNKNFTLYEGYNPKVPLRAWAVLIPSRKNRIEILVSNDDDGVESPSEIAKIVTLLLL